MSSDTLMHAAQVGFTEHNTTHDLQKVDYFMVADDMKIESINPIITKESEVVIKCADGLNKIPTLEIIGLDEMQPCIGPVTYTGMSFGRWSITNDKVLKKIIIDGVYIRVSPKNPVFSIGTYGLEQVPEIELRNGGYIECPEIAGERVLLAKVAPPPGSTKISKLPEYYILKEGEKRPLSSGQKLLIEEFEKKGVYDEDICSGKYDTAHMELLLGYLSNGYNIEGLRDPEIDSRNLAYVEPLLKRGYDLVGDGVIREIKRMSYIDFSFMVQRVLFVRGLKDATPEQDDFIMRTMEECGDIYQTIKLYFSRYIASNKQQVDFLSDEQVDYWWDLISPIMFYGSGDKKKDLCVYLGTWNS